MFAGFLFVVRARTLASELDAGLQLRANHVAADVPSLLTEADPQGRLALYASFSRSPFEIRRDAGRIVFRSPSFPRIDEESERTLTEPVSRLGLPVRTVRDLSGSTFRVAVERVLGPRNEPLAVLVAEPTAPNRRTLGQLAIAETIGIVLVLLAARVGSAFTARRALAPVDEIVCRVRDIHADHLGERLHIDAETEDVERLVGTLNQLLDRLEEPVYGARRFAADVSHELQTPITAMRFALEACQRTERTPEGYRTLATDLLNDVDRLSTLIRDLRLFATAGSGRLFATPEPIDLAAVADECVDIARAIGEAKQIRVELDAEPGLIVVGSGLHLRRAILNLTDNAIRYSPPDSTIAVSVKRDNGSALVTVQDMGCGISSSDLPHIFEPFYRADPARARDTGGSGLGLAIADQVVRAHGGRIAVSSTPDHGSTFEIHLPLASPALGRTEPSIG